MGRGVLAGASSAIQAERFMSATPASVMVGTCGSTGERVGLITPSANSLPDATCGTASGITANITSTVPANVSVIAGAPPL
jgi:hypothetical protein